LQRIGIEVRDTITLKDLIHEVERDYKFNGKKSEDRLKFSNNYFQMVCSILQRFRSHLIP